MPVYFDYFLLNRRSIEPPVAERLTGRRRGRDEKRRRRRRVMGSVAMDSDYGVPRELSALQKARALYRPDLPPCLQVTCPSYPKPTAAAAVTTLPSITDHAVLVRLSPPAGQIHPVDGGSGGSH